MTTYVEAAAKKKRMPGVIPLHGDEGFAGMHKAGALTAEVLDLMVPMVEPGVPTAKLDRFVYEFARDNGATPATLTGVSGRPTTASAGETIP